MKIPTILPSQEALIFATSVFGFLLLAAYLGMVFCQKRGIPKPSLEESRRQLKVIEALYSTGVSAAVAGTLSALMLIAKRISLLV